MGIIKTPWTLRDARRKLHRREMKGEECWFCLSHLIVRFSFSPDIMAAATIREAALYAGLDDHIHDRLSFGGPDCYIDTRLADRLISKLGPNWSLEGSKQSRNHKKDTDKVDGSSQTGDMTHGGDSNSGEVEGTSAMSMSKEDRDGGDQHSGPGQPGGKREPLSGQDDSNKEDRDHQQAASDPPLQPEAANDSKEGEQIGQDGTPEKQGSGKEDASSVDPDEPALGKSEQAGSSSRPPVGFDKPDREDQTQAKGTDQDFDEQSMEAYEGNRDACPTVPRHSWGGVNASLDRVVVSSGSKDAAKEVKRALKKLFIVWSVGNCGEDSPRLDGQKLISEIISNRCQLSRARKQELEHRYVLLLCDVSGSCSASAPGTLAACVSIQKSWQDTVGVIVHSNGFIEEWGLPISLARELPGLPPYDTPWSSSYTLNILSPYIKSDRIAGTVAFGDSDALDNYIELARHGKLVWLDSYGASRIGLRDRSRAMRRKLPLARTACHNVIYWTGVNSATTAAMALRRAIRSQR